MVVELSGGSNFLRKLEDIEASIIELQLREDQDARLSEEDSIDLRMLSTHHSLALVGATLVT